VVNKNYTVAKRGRILLFYAFEIIRRKI